MKKKQILVLLTILISLGMLVSACQQPAAEQPAAEQPAAEEPAAEEPAAEEPAAEEPAAEEPAAEEAGGFQIPEAVDGQFNVAIVLI